MIILFSKNIHKDYDNTNWDNIDFQYKLFLNTRMQDFKSLNKNIQKDVKKQPHCTVKTK